MKLFKNYEIYKQFQEILMYIAFIAYVLVFFLAFSFGLVFICGEADFTTELWTKPLGLILWGICGYMGYKFFN